MRVVPDWDKSIVAEKLGLDGVTHLATASCPLTDPDEEEVHG